MSLGYFIFLNLVFNSSFPLISKHFKELDFSTLWSKEAGCDLLPKASQILKKRFCWILPILMEDMKRNWYSLKNVFFFIKSSISTDKPFWTAATLLLSSGSSYHWGQSLCEKLQLCSACTWDTNRLLMHPRNTLFHLHACQTDTHTLYCVLQSLKKKQTKCFSCFCI